jgi:ABC-type dipeptide/oligopeptide/nickel transport system permease component
MRVSRKSIGILTALLLTGALLATILPNWRWHLSPAAIQSQLLAETPLGTSEEQVLRYLQARGLKPAPLWRGTVAANTIYPPSTAAGNSFTHAVVGEYGLIFTTSVEAFYVFGRDRRLVEIAVRKTTDAL